MRSEDEWDSVGAGTAQPCEAAPSLASSEFSSLELNLGARPSGFEPETFGSVDRRPSGLLRSTERNSRLPVALKSPETPERTHFGRPVRAAVIRSLSTWCRR